MVRIFFGKRDAFKTTFVERDFLNTRNADGFSCHKVFDGKAHIGYDLIHLKNNQTCPFIRKISNILPNWHEEIRVHNHYSFSKEGFEFARHIVDEAISNHVKCFYVDEVSRLEIQKKGFYPLIKRLLKVKDLDVVLAVRESVVRRVVDVFNIPDCLAFKLAFTKSKPNIEGIIKYPPWLVQKVDEAEKLDDFRMLIEKYGKSLE